MAEEDDSEKRLRSVMDKLFPSPKPNPLTSNTKPAEVAKRGNSTTHGLIAESSNFSGGSSVAFRGSNRSSVLVGSSSSPQPPLCRPWDREDLIRRLSTFKSMTWFAKPKVIINQCNFCQPSCGAIGSSLVDEVVSAVSCARRGWINVEMDIIACEACGVRLLFSTPASWTQQQVEKAAAVFSLKLNDGHRLLCPWIDNACDERLLHFPPTPAPALVDSYRKRFAALLQLSALPVISSLTIDRMRSPQLEHFLENSSMLGCGNGIVHPGRIDYLHNEHEAVSTNLYHQALKLISLCGWVPRSLPYMVDCGNPSTQSAEGDRFKDLFPQVITGPNTSTILSSTSDADESVKVNGDHSPLLQLSDPASVVLDCKLCGASVGLWAFSTVRQPLEYIRLVESSEGDDGCITRNSGTDHSINENNSGHNGGSMDGAIFKEKPLGLNLSIAGGPPPAKQNYRAKVSLPIISRYLRTGLFSDFNIRDHNVNSMSFKDHSIPPSDLQNTSLQQNKDHTNPCSKIIESDDMRRTELQRNETEPSFLSEDRQSCLNCKLSEGASKSGKETLATLEGRSFREQGVLPEQAVGTFSDCSIENQTESTDNMLQVSSRNNNSREYDQSLGDTQMSDISFQVRECVPTGPDVNSRIVGRLTSQDNSMMVTTETFPQQLDKDLISGSNLSHEDTCKTRDCVSSDVTCLEINTNVETACKMDSLSADRGFDFGKSSNMQGTKQECKGIMPTLQPAANDGIAGAQSLRKDLPVVQSDQGLVFDPIAQHRYFCPWIESNGTAACGWQLTLSALHRDKDSSHLLLGDSSKSSSLELDDPIASVRKLFTSPPSKRKKTSTTST